jgi:hypothetical protein
MQMKQFTFETTDWSKIAPTEHKGEPGMAYWRTRTFGDIRVRLVEYTPSYFADHWCSKGHILAGGLGLQEGDKSGVPQSLPRAKSKSLS